MALWHHSPFLWGPEDLLECLYDNISLGNRRRKKEEKKLRWPQG